MFRIKLGLELGTGSEVGDGDFRGGADVQGTDVSRSCASEGRLTDEQVDRRTDGQTDGRVSAISEASGRAQNPAVPRISKDRIAPCVSQMSQCRQQPSPPLNAVSRQ